MERSDVFKSAKMWARTEWPDGKHSVPVWVEKIVCPFATVTPIREATVQDCISVRLSESRIAIYVPLDPESAFIFPDTEKELPQLVLNAQRGCSTGTSEREELLSPHIDRGLEGSACAINGKRGMLNLNLLLYNM
jgi:hypothetical protein